MFEHGLWFNGRYWPPISGGSGEEGGDYSSDAGSAVMSGEADYAPAETPEPQSFSEEPPEGDEPESDSPQAPQASAIERFAQGLQAPHQQAPAPAPAPIQQIAQEAQQLQVAEALALQRIQAQLPYLPEDQQQGLLMQFQQARVQAQARIVQLQGEAQRAMLEPHIRELTLDRLVDVAREDNPQIDAKDLRAELKALADSGAPARSVLEQTQRYVQRYRETALKDRDAKGTDRMGGGTPRSGNALKGKSTVELLSMGYAQSKSAPARRGRGR